MVELIVEVVWGSWFEAVGVELWSEGGASAVGADELEVVEVGSADTLVGGVDVGVRSWLEAVGDGAF